MKEITIHSILAGIAEEAAPSAEIDLWEGIHRHLESSESQFHQGEPLMKPNFAKRPFVRGMALAALALVFAIALLFAIPQGRAWAQEVIHFFSRASSDTQPVTPLPLTVTQDPGYVFNKAIADAGKQAGFDALEPAWLPVDSSGKQLLSFEGASFEPDHKIVRVFYRFALGDDTLTDGLVLREERIQTVDDCELCGMVGASALIEQIQIGALPGEYVPGVWKADDSGVWKWESDPYIQTLRWQKGGLALEIQYFGMEVEKADLIAIAKSMK